MLYDLLHFGRILLRITVTDWILFVDHTLYIIITNNVGLGFFLPTSPFGIDININFNLNFILILILQNICVLLIHFSPIYSINGPL